VEPPEHRHSAQKPLRAIETAKPMPRQAVKSASATAKSPPNHISRIERIVAISNPAPSNRGKKIVQFLISIEATHPIFDPGIPRMIDLMQSR
jgi:hypothetical protein